MKQIKTELIDIHYFSNTISGSIAVSPTMIISASYDICYLYNHDDIKITKKTLFVKLQQLKGY